MPVATYTKSGAKAATPVKLDKAVFGVKADSHEVLKSAYTAYLANGRANLAITKTRGLISGGGKKPWRQKGTGRARFGSSRNPIWRGGGIVFGPTGQENYKHNLNVRAKRQAVRQALSVAADSDKIKVVEAFSAMDAKTKAMATFLNKLDAHGNVLCVVTEREPAKERATTNIPGLKLILATYLSVYDILNADHIIFSKDSLVATTAWLNKPLKVSRSSEEAK